MSEFLKWAIALSIAAILLISVLYGTLYLDQIYTTWQSKQQAEQAKITTQAIADCIKKLPASTEMNCNAIVGL